MTVHYSITAELGRQRQQQIACAQAVELEASTRASSAPRGHRPAARPRPAAGNPGDARSDRSATV